MKEEIQDLRALLADIIDALKDRDESIKTWIEERLEEIEQSSL